MGYYSDWIMGYQIGDYSIFKVQRGDHHSWTKTQVGVLENMRLLGLF